MMIIITNEYNDNCLPKQSILFCNGVFGAWKRKCLFFRIQKLIFNILIKINILNLLNCFSYYSLNIRIVMLKFSLLLQLISK